eukprot:5740601-Amphidinium_carterae.2
MTINRFGAKKARYNFSRSAQQPHYKEFWAIVLDWGAVSVCPQSFCPHLPMTAMTEEARRQYVTVTGEGLNISGWKETTMVIGKILMQ